MSGKQVLEKLLTGVCILLVKMHLVMIVMLAGFVYALQTHPAFGVFAAAVIGMIAYDCVLTIRNILRMYKAEKERLKKMTRSAPSGL